MGVTSTLTMGKKLAILSGTMIILTVLAIYTGVSLLQENNHWANVKGSTAQLYGLFFEQSTNLRGYLLSGDQSFLNDLEADRKAFQANLEEAKSLTNDQDIQNILAKFQADEKRWHEQVANPAIEMRKRVNSGQASLAELNEKFLAVYYGNFLLAEFSIRKDSQDLVTAPNKKMEAVRSQANIILLSILAVEVVVGTSLSVAISRSIIRPVKILQDAASVISSGDLTVDIQSVGRDEVGKLATSFRSMTANLRTLGSKVVVAATDVSSASRQIASSTREISQSSQIVSSTLQQIASGAVIQAKKLDEANQIVSRLRTTMNELASKAKEAATLSNVAVESAKAGTGAAGEAGRKILRITDVAEDSAERVRGLSARSNQITSILEVIRQIADQTNLLALNATIEAAKAGSAGRGFAIVADEVRRLAEDSAKATSDVASLIQRIQEDAKTTARSIEEGTREIAEGKLTVDRALHALEEIATKVQQVAVNVTLVVDSIQEQVSAVSRLSRATAEVALITEENTSAVKEVSSDAGKMAHEMREFTDAAERLAELSQNLQLAVSNFKLPAPEELPKEKGKTPEKGDPTVQIGQVKPQ